MPPSLPPLPTCWAVTDGAAGMESQAIGLAEAIGLTPVVKRIRLRQPWKLLVPHLRVALAHAFSADGDRIAPPWPDILVGCGRLSIAASLAARQLSGGRTFTIQLQNPRTRPDRFDMIVAPRHDDLTGANVIVTQGAIHRVTARRLAAAAQQFAPRLDRLPRPRVAVLIGGSNGVYQMTPAVVAAMADRLAALCRDFGAGLMVTPSRRTGAANEAVLRQKLAGLPAEVWDGRGDNPYFGYLGLADAVVVTGDSVSMISEACSIGKPVYVIELEGGSRRFNRFHQLMRDDGLVRPFTGVLEDWTGKPLTDNQTAGAELRRRLAARGIIVPPPADGTG